MTEPAQRPFLDAIVGARPNMMKMAPLARALKADGRFRLRLVHTGQHYDHALSEAFFSELGLQAPDVNLNVGSGPQGAQTARILESYERVLLEPGKQPRGVIVVGDVTSTMACTLAAVKLGIPVAHVEAGLRSGDRTMPEEINRIVTDALADLLFVSDPDGLSHLAREGRPSQRTWLVGNVMVDTLFENLPRAGQSLILKNLGLTPGEYAYVTLHRPLNVDQAAVLSRLLAVFREMSRELPVVFALHPRTGQRMKEFGLSVPPNGQFQLIGPLAYLDNLRMLQCARAVLTDSGGIQEETSVLGVPCLTLRFHTERPVTVELGSSELVGNDPVRIREAWRAIMTGTWKKARPIPLWDGHAAERIVEHIAQEWR